MRGAVMKWHYRGFLSNKAREIKHFENLSINLDLEMLLLQFFIAE